MKRILLLSLMFSLTFAFSALAQRTVSGTVTDDGGATVPGVNVVLKGTTTGTTTDLDGNYRLSVPEEGGTLVYSFIGMAQQEVQIGARSVIDVSMASDVKQLTEVVVTAIGIERDAKALGYSVENISGEQVQRVAEPDPLRAMQGKVAGVTIGGSGGSPGSATRLTIRGNSSLLGNNQPLFVVDGVPYDNSQNSTSNNTTRGTAYSSRIADLDPNNIESVNILKGGSAAALYGTRAANGVVVITTKTGGSGARNKGLEIAVNSSVAMEQISNLPDYQNSYGTGTAFNYAQANGSWGAPFVGAQPYATLTEIPHWYNNQAGFEEFWGTNVPYQAYPDNVEKLFRNGMTFENSISVTGSGEKSRISLVASRLENDGYVPETFYDKTSISLGGRSFLDNGVVVGGNLAFTSTDRRTVQQGIGASGSNNSSAFARALYMGRNWDVHGQPYTNPLDGGSAFMVGRGQADNPLWSYENAGGTEEVTRIVASFDVSYDITEWLNATYRVGFNTYNQANVDFLRPGSTGPSDNAGVGSVTNDDIFSEEIDHNLILGASGDINEDFAYRITAGANINQRTRDRQSVRGLGYVVFDIDDIDNTNDVVPNGGTFSQRRIVGVYGDAYIGYRDWAFLTLTARNDWSSTLPEGGNSFFYPAANASIIVSDALGWTSKTLSLLKLRAGWSRVGNDTDPYQLNAIYGINNTSYLPFEGTPGAFLSTIERDANLKPERTTELELGLQASLFDGRVGVDVAVYDKISEDQIADISLASETGFYSLFTNFGSVSNRGIEITVDVTPVSLPNNGFRWDLTGVFTHNKNTIEALTGGVDEIFLPGGYLVSTVHRAGNEFGLIYGSMSARDDEGNLLINPANGQLIRSPELGVIGNPNPDFIAGLTNSFSWKGISLSAVFDLKMGGDIYSNTVLSMLGRGVTKDTEDREMTRIIPGVYGDPNTYQPIRTEGGDKIQNQTLIETNSMYFGETFAINAANEWSVFDGTVMRLRQAAIGYTFPKSLLSKTPFGSASINVTGRNLWFWAPFMPEHTNFDPEVNQAGAGNVQGVEYSATPTVKRYAVNLRFTF